MLAKTVIYLIILQSAKNLNPQTQVYHNKLRHFIIYFRNRKKECRILQTVVLIGGDDRSRYLNTYFHKQGFLTYCFGLDCAIDMDSLQAALRSNIAAVILPLPATRDGQTVHIPLTGDILPFETLCALLRTDTVVFGGMLPEAVTEQFFKRGIRTVDYYDDSVVLQNAVLTAKGAMQVLLRHRHVPIGKLRIAVAGYGRVARAVVGELLPCGCTPTVAARREEARSAAREKGCKAISVAELQRDPSAYDVLLNTVPARLFSWETLEKTKPDVLLLELASAPFGFDFEAARAIGREIVNAQSLPGKYAPQAAATIIGEKIKSLL